MSTGDMLSVGKTIKEAKQNIALRRDNLTTSRFTKRYPDISEDLWDLIVKLITTSQYQRIGQNGGVDEILEHQWFCDIDISKIQSQALESPIFDIVTKEENILKLTEVTPDKYTQYWDNKEKKARKVLNKSHIDFGQNFINEFHEFIPVNVIEADTEGKHRDSMMIIRNHTMSSIRKQREASLFEENSVSADGYESPLENPISLSGKDSISLISKEKNSPIINEGEAQSGIVS